MRVLVVGCGSIGRRHAQNARRLGADAVGVFDADPQAARAAATVSGASVHESLAAALAWSPDGVVVATPPDSHVTIACAALAAGAHVLIEKPLAAECDDAARLLSAARGAQRQAYVVCNMRFHPGPATLKAELATIGEPLFARAHFGSYLPTQRPGTDYRTLYVAERARGGGVILDAIHEIDYLCWMFGVPRSVQCDTARLSALEIETEDYASLNLRHSSGVCSAIQLDYLQQFKRRGCEIVGTAGTLVWESEGKAPERCLVRHFDAARERWSAVVDVADLDKAAPYVAVMERFLAALRGEAPDDLLDAEMAGTELAAALAAHRAAATGQRQALAGTP